MSHVPSRQSFLARMLGLATAGAFAPRVAIASLVPSSTNKASGSSAAFRFRPQPMAVARGNGSA